MLLVARDWYPLVLFPVLYPEVEVLAAVMGDWRLTGTVAAAEAALFGGHPSLYLSERLPFVPLSEFLHPGFLAYVVVIPAVAAWWYFRGRRGAFHDLVLLLAAVMYGSYLFFILFPVDSPYYRFDCLAAPLAGNPFFDLVHGMSARGGARGGAFPSAHVSGALVVVLVAWRHQRRLAVALVPIVAGADRGDGRRPVPLCGRRHRRHRAGAHGGIQPASNFARSSSTAFSCGEMRATSPRKPPAASATARARSSPILRTSARSCAVSDGQIAWM